MFNKKLIILILLAIFCIGITISSVSANESYSNLTTTKNSGFLNENENFDNEFESNDDNNLNILTQKEEELLTDTVGRMLPTVDYYDYFDVEDCTDKHQLGICVQLCGNNGASLGYYDPNPEVTYIVKNQNGFVVYNNTLKGSNVECVYFPSNYDIFKNLPNGVYTCTLTTITKTFSGNNPGTYTPMPNTWKVNVPSTKTPSQSSSNHYIKYIKVGKYKVPIWSDDSLNTQKNKVIKYLKKHVKKGHTFKIHGYKFKVSAKVYRKILYYKKYGFDEKMGSPYFKAKTNKNYIYKDPLFKNKPITKTKLKYKYILNGKSYYKNGIYHYKSYYTVSKYFDNGWKFDSYASSRNNQGGYNDYSVIKKKIKYTTNKEVISGYKKLKLKVYAFGIETMFKVGVQFCGVGHGYKHLPITRYILL